MGCESQYLSIAIIESMKLYNLYKQKNEISLKNISQNEELKSQVLDFNSLIATQYMCELTDKTNEFISMLDHNEKMTYLKCISNKDTEIKKIILGQSLPKTIYESIKEEELNSSDIEYVRKIDNTFNKDKLSTLMNNKFGFDEKYAFYNMIHTKKASIEDICKYKMKYNEKLRNDYIKYFEEEIIDINKPNNIIELLNIIDDFSSDNIEEEEEYSNKDFIISEFIDRIFDSNPFDLRFLYHESMEQDDDYI